MSSIAEDDGSLPVEWWSAPQAAVWIATRDEKAVKDAAHDKGFAYAKRRKLLSVSVAGALPIALEAAPAELLRKACEDRFKIMGSRWGDGTPEEVPVETDGLRIGDRYDERAGCVRAQIGDNHSFSGWTPASPYWQHLYVSAGECRKCWPPETSRIAVPLDASESIIEHVETEAAVAPVAPTRNTATIDMPPLPAPTPTGPVGNRPFDDSKLVAEVAAAKRRGDFRSYRAAATARAAEISGYGTPESKIKRIAEKARNWPPRPGR
jgi:hypothetical protein